jgi:dienelactone hydrolase
MLRLTLSTFVAMLLAAAYAAGQSVDRRAGPVDVPLAPDNKQLWWVPVTAPDSGFGPVLLETQIYRPSGPGPFPLVTINHGRPRRGGTDPRSMHPDYAAAVHWFVERGFAVAVPMRRGFGLSDGSIDPPVCANGDYFGVALKTAVDMEGVVKYLRGQSFVDAGRVVVVGHSYGGLGALGVAYDSAEGVIGIVNFAGGAGSYRPGEICFGPERLVAAVGRLGERNRLPQIWLYAANDHYFEPSLAHAMADAYRAGSKAPVSFIDLPSFGEDGHATLSRGDPVIWGAAVAQFLAGLKIPGYTPKP